MKFPTPIFDLLTTFFRADPQSTHICRKGVMHGAPSPAETSAARMSEALCLANGILRSRASLLEQVDRGDGKHAMLGNYGYKADMCAHGMARGAMDLAYFLVEHWGQPYSVAEPTKETAKDHELTSRTGVIAFLNLQGEPRASGHIDLWEGSKCIGKPHWNCRKMMFWKLD
jgi:hypothetical protein